MRRCACVKIDVELAETSLDLGETGDFEGCVHVGLAQRKRVAT
jgi:hypothetical protein